MKLEAQQRMYTALKRIANFTPAGRLKRNAEKEYGLSGGDCIEVAYENVIAEAKQAIRGLRKPRQQ